MYMKRHLLKLDYLFCVVLVCSGQQQAFIYMENKNHYSIIIILSVIPTRLMKLDATAYFQCAKDDVKSVKQHTRT